MRIENFLPLGTSFSSQFCMVPNGPTCRSCQELAYLPIPTRIFGGSSSCNKCDAIIFYTLWMTTCKLLPKHCYLHIRQNDCPFGHAKELCLKIHCYPSSFAGTLTVQTVRASVVPVQANLMFRQSQIVVCPEWTLSDDGSLTNNFCL